MNGVSVSDKQGLILRVGLYILLAVGTKLLPERLRIKRAKLWMRSVLALWWIVLALGVATYIRWYGSGFS